MPALGGIGRGLLKGALSATEKAAEKVKDAAGAAARTLGDDEEPATAPDSSPAAAATPPDAAPAAPTRPAAEPPTPPVDAPPVAPAVPSTATPVATQPAAAAPVDVEPDEPALADEPVDQADPAEVLELVEMFQRLLVSRRPPPGPIQDEWSVGLGDVFAEHPRLPKRVRGLVTRLNRVGGLAYSPQEITFDGEDVPWEKVTEVRTRHVVDYLLGDAVQQQVENLPMPWFPGRRRLLDAFGQALLTVTIATAKDQLDRLDLDLRVPAEIEYRGSFGRRKELNAGVLSALVLADPAVNASVLATARANGVLVRTTADEMLADAGHRADAIREKIAALEAELDKFTKRFGRTG